MTEKQHTAIAEVYSMALFNFAQKQGIVDVVYEEMDLVQKKIMNIPGLHVFLEAPHISSEDKHQFITDLLEPNFSKVVANLFHLMVEADRALDMNSIIEAFKNRVEKLKGIVPGYIKSAVVLTDAEKQRLQSSLEKLTHKKLHIRYSVEPELIGGLLFKAEKILIDDTVRGHLRQMSENLETLEISL